MPLYNVPDGGPHGLTVVASDAPAIIRARADYRCDGIADDVEINAAILKGQRVLLSEGTFGLLGSINIDRAGVNVLGCGMGATILNVPVANTPAQAIYMGSGANRSDMRVADLKVQWNGQVAGIGILGRGERLRIERVHVVSAPGDGIQLGSSGGTVYEGYLQDCRIYSAGRYGVYIPTGVSDATLDNIMVCGGVDQAHIVTTEGIRLYGTLAILKNCHVWFCTTGLYAYDANPQVQIIGGYFESCTNGVYLNEGKWGRIQGVGCYNNTGYDIQLRNDYRGLIENSVLSSAAANNLLLNGAQDCRVVGNSFENATGIAARIYAGSTRCKIVYNVTRNNTACSDDFTLEGATYCDVIGNTCNNGILEVAPGDWNIFNRNLMLAGAVVKVGANSTTIAR